jgi:hypothetical protein
LLGRRVGAFFALGRFYHALAGCQGTTYTDNDHCL